MNRHFVDYNLTPAPYVAMSDPAKTPSQIAADLAEARRKAQAEDAKAYGSMKAPAAPAPREQPYRPEGFDFAYVDRKGHQGEVIPGRPAPAALRAPIEQPAESIITPLAPSAGVVVDAPDEWQSGAPPSVGWFSAEVNPVVRGDLARYFDGTSWRGCVVIDTKSPACKTLALKECVRGGVDVRWRGPRLTGAAWPEPPQ